MPVAYLGTRLAYGIVNCFTLTRQENSESKPALISGLFPAISPQPISCEIELNG
jgi:hypothetical protein